MRPHILEMVANHLWMIAGSHRSIEWGCGRLVDMGVRLDNGVACVEERVCANCVRRVAKFSRIHRSVL